jgi:multidrug efflux pump subunit AcrB
VSGPDTQGSGPESAGGGRRGVIEWMVDNRVTPNLLMVALIAGGLFMSTRIKQEVFPEFDLDMITISVAYPGASPEEVEQGIILVVEEAIRGIEGIVEVRSTSAEGLGLVNAELRVDADQDRIYREVQQAVDSIRTFPGDAERPDVAQSVRRREVLTVQIYGEVSERALREVAESVRDRLLQDGGITQVDVVGARAPEIHVEVPQERLRAHGLTLETVAQRIAAGSVELPAGTLKTRGGEILLRVPDRRDWARELDGLPVLRTDAGGVLSLGELAEVSEGFEDVDRFASFNGQPTIALDVFRVGDETPIGVSDAARAVMAAMERELPKGIGWDVRSDQSDIYRQRLELLLKNAFLGLVLVLVVLGLFLDLRLAFWVTMGIPTSFLGGLIFLGGMGVSINMISMFAFIVALGIVVDDAIIVGENVYEMRTRGASLYEAAVAGAKGVAVPVAFSILSNVVTFLPLAFIPGFMGKVWAVIPVVVITVFLVSWVESVLILPSHLVHAAAREQAGPGRVRRFQDGVAALLASFVDRVYQPFLTVCLRWRAVVMAVALATIILVGGFVSGRRIGVVFMPRVESDYAVVTATLPVGSPPATVAAVRDRLVQTAQAVGRDHGGDRLMDGVFARVEDNTVEVLAYLTDPDVRPISTGDVVKLWRAETGAISGLESLRFQSDRGGPGSGAGVTVQLAHRDIETLSRASKALAASLEELANVKDVDDGYTPGKTQLDVHLNPAGESLGLTSASVARQLRSAFYGTEAQRQQRDRDEVKVLVRYPEAERVSEHDVSTLLITTPAGTTVPLPQVASIDRGRAYTSIVRVDGRRTLTVTADVEPMSQTSQVIATLTDDVLPELTRDFPGLTWTFEGRQADMGESAGALGSGFLLALIALYFLLAIPFKSYLQPIIVMIAIPFGIIGAVIGHVIMGYDLSLLSMMGVIALSGVVVNDSLVLVDFANGRRAEGLSARAAIVEACSRRFRPVLLTTLTTFGGLAPMMLETSRQARFLIPMALSLGFGIVFATAITLVIVPALYVMVDDLARLTAGRRNQAPEAEATLAG